MEIRCRRCAAAAVVREVARGNGRKGWRQGVAEEGGAEGWRAITQGDEGAGESGYLFTGTFLFYFLPTQGWV